jgi:hypothetical protein
MDANVGAEVRAVTGSRELLTQLDAKPYSVSVDGDY